jgi:hypothetical protein
MQTTHTNEKTNAQLNQEFCSICSILVSDQGNAFWQHRLIGLYAALVERGLIAPWGSGPEANDGKEALANLRY